jgi:hypothetical protein
MRMRKIFSILIPHINEKMPTDVPVGDEKTK